MILEKLIEQLLPIAKRFLPEDPDKAADLAQQMALARLAADSEIRKAQLEVNKAEAQSGNWFAASWRPSIGWWCSLAIGANYVAIPLMKAVAAWQGHPFDLAPFDLSVMLPIIFAMLGMASIRSHDKLKGLTK